MRVGITRGSSTLDVITACQKLMGLEGAAREFYKEVPKTCCLELLQGVSMHHCQDSVCCATFILHSGDACNIHTSVSFLGNVHALPAGFAQWKAIIHLLLGCEEGPLRSHVQLFSKALRCLLCQLQHSLTQVRAFGTWHDTHVVHRAVWCTVLAGI